VGNLLASYATAEGLEQQPQRDRARHLVPGANVHAVWGVCCGETQSNSVAALL
jgi:hypothetical protein